MSDIPWTPSADQLVLLRMSAVCQGGLQGSPKERPDARGTLTLQDG